MKRNTYPTTCTTCGTKMPAGHGPLTKVAGRWVVTCAPVTTYGDDDGYDAMKDAMLESGEWFARRGRWA